MKVISMLPFIALGWLAALIWNGLKTGWVLYRDWTF